MTYLMTLYSKSVDQFVTDCNSAIYWEGDLADWIAVICKYYNERYCVNDFEIISIVKLGA